MNRPDAVGVLFVVMAAAGFAIGGPLARVASDLGFTAVTFATWRAISSAAALLALLAIGVAIHRADTTPWSAIARRERVQLLAMGVFVTGTTLGLFSAFERITIALGLIVFYAYPLMVAVAASRFIGEPLGSRRLLAILIATAGMALMVLAPGNDGAGPQIELLGVFFAFVAALCQTGYALVASRGFSSVPAFQASTILRGMSLLIYLVVLLPLVLLSGDGGHLVDPLSGPEAWIVIIVAGLFSAALPTASLVAGYRRIGPTRGAVLMLFEPVVGVLLAALWLAERPAPAQLVGGLLVLLGAGLVQMTPVSSALRSTAPPSE